MIPNKNNYYAFAAEEDESSTKMMNTNTNKNTTTYTDEVLKFSLSYPTDSWQLLVGETGGSGDRSGSRQVIAFAPKNANPERREHFFSGDSSRGGLPEDGKFRIAVRVRL